MEKEERRKRKRDESVDRKEKVFHHKKGKKKKRHSERHSSSSSSSSESERKKEKRRSAKKKKKILKKAKKKMKKKLDKLKSLEKKTDLLEENDFIGPKPEETAKALAPMTKEEWEKSQSVIRRVLDPETGRQRLIKGDGEVIEEVVTYKRHKEINKKATLADGEYFQSQLRK